MEVARGLAHINGASNASLYALTWLAAARMFALGRLPALKSLHELSSDAGWLAVAEAGLPAEAVRGLNLSGSASSQEAAQRTAAVAAVVELHEELGAQPWDVLPYLCSTGSRLSLDPEGGLAPSVCELLLDLAGPVNSGTLWVPFDASGQLSLSAFRRGWTVIAASPLGSASMVAQILLAIETGAAVNPRMTTAVQRNEDGRPTTRADCVLSFAPFGLHVKDSRLAQWDSSGGTGVEMFARSETWAIYEMVNRAERRAVFVAPQGVLFTKGQELRMREYLLHRGGENNELEAVIALPPGVFSSTSLAGAILVVNPGGGTDRIRMVDLTGKRTGISAGGLIDNARAIALGLQPCPERAKEVSRDDIQANEFSFVPSRYLRRTLKLDAHAIPLGDICIAVRPPPLAKEKTGTVAFEVGIPELGSWTAQVGPFNKTIGLKAKTKDVPSLEKGDLVLSIKGTVGKVGLMGHLPSGEEAVVSQSCLALRLRSGPQAKGVCPEYLLMYLRSAEGQSQLEGLQVGSVVQHISPSTLMNSVLISVPSQELQGKVVEDYRRLCDLERQIDELTKEIASVASRHWNTEATKYSEEAVGIAPSIAAASSTNKKADA